jgi:alpha,alpha-trehalase
MRNIETIDILLEDLFHEVQMQQIFPDSKTFVDCIPKGAPSEILKRYHSEKANPTFELKSFVEEHFDLPPEGESVESSGDKNIVEHIHHLWDGLTRQSTKTDEGSLLTLPYPFVIPGGRFREIYYWDSYFTMLGLLKSERIDLVKNMVDNFTFLIQTYGHIPNGNRTYFLSRSQPPFYALMVDLLCENDPSSSHADYLPTLLKEYQFWMDGADNLEVGKALRRVVNVDGYCVNRYFDDTPKPRQESYWEDVNEGSNLEDPESFHLHLRAACESGWDFSSRWLSDPHDIKTIETANIIPVDLNCLMAQLETTIATAYAEKGLMKESKRYAKKATERLNWIETQLWNEEEGCFTDWHFIKQKAKKNKTAAGLFPLFISKNINPNKAAKNIETLAVTLLKSGGLLTTDQYTDQQWDAPNGWPPLQWIAFQAFLNYDREDLANKLKEAWTLTCEKKFDQDHKMIEKYNVIDALSTAKGGEYEAQDGFGWSNGVYLALKLRD